MKEIVGFCFPLVFLFFLVSLRCTSPSPCQDGFFFYFFFLFFFFFYFPNPSHHRFGNSLQLYQWS